MDSTAPLPAPDSIIALLASLNFDKTIEFYQQLDFTLVSRHDDYLLMRHGESGPELHFWLTEDRSIAEATGAYVRSADVDALSARWRARSPGMRITKPEDKSWGMREFYVFDPSGNLLRVGQAL
jgi:catechol 2,3-dioxygenase-like lactoylglutathione lyase family enzyme